MEWINSKVEELAQILVKYDLTDIEIRNGEDWVKLKKTIATIQTANNQGSTMIDNKNRTNADFSRIIENKILQDGLTTMKTIQNNEGPNIASPTMAYDEREYVTSPTTGIFYRQSQPGNPPYAEVGQKVKKGDIICLVEAMKMINEIAANHDGVIKRFLAENEQFVEFGAPLVLIEEE